MNCNKIKDIKHDLEKKKKRNLAAINEKQGRKCVNIDEVLRIWKSHFETHLNTSFPHDPDALNSLKGELRPTNFLLSDLF